MKRIHLLALPLVCGLALAFSPTSNSPTVAAGDQDEHHEESPLHEGMDALNRSFRTLRKSLRDKGRHEESLAVIVEAQRGASMAKTEVPPIAAKQPEAERAAFVVEYRLELIQVERALLDLEQAVLEDDYEKAQELLKSTKKMEGPGHDRFTEEEE